MLVMLPDTLAAAAATFWMNFSKNWGCWRVQWLHKYFLVPGHFHRLEKEKYIALIWEEEYYTKLIKKLYMEAASMSCLSLLKKYLAISNQRNTAIKSAQAIFLHALQALNSSLPLLRTTSTYTTIQPKVQTLFIISWFSIYFINKNMLCTLMTLIYT